MSSTFIEHSPKPEEDKSLILIMDNDGNVTTDPAHFEKLISNQKLPDVGIKIVRLDSSQTDNESNGDGDSKQELKLTVEEICPEPLALGADDPTVNVMSPPLEILPGPSNEHISHDIVDPFSQMDPEQLQRLEHALASEQAKQILGENVAAMLDMLSVDDSPAAFLQNSIKNDHCYTNLLPSSDPNGPSFFMNDTRTREDASRGKGKAKVGTPIKGRKVVASSVNVNPNVIRRPVQKEIKQIVKQSQQIQQQLKQTTLSDYGMSARAAQSKYQEKAEDSSYEEDVDVEESEGSDDEADNLSDEDYNNRSSRTKRKPRKNKKKIIVKSSVPRGFSRSVVKPGSRIGKRSTMTPEIRARNEKLNDAMSKIVESMDGSGTKEIVVDNTDLKKGIKKIKSKIVGEESNTVSEKTVKEVSKPAEESDSGTKGQPAKYPKRENRKPPAHLTEAFGPALFSAPDIIRRVSTGEDSHQTTPEKKNFTVGAQKLADRGINKLTPSKTETPVSEANKIKPKVSPKETLKPSKPVKVEENKTRKVEDKTLLTKTSEVPGSNKTNLEIQKLLEKHQVKHPLYNEDQDYSDENIDDNYYLDPTQMDQSLLEGFSQAGSKSEDQLLQEAILLQEQLIESNKGVVIPEPGSVSLGDAQVQIPLDTETIEDIQNEITSAILVANSESSAEGKQTIKFDQEQRKHVPGEITQKKENKVAEMNSGNEQDGEDGGDGNLVVDENKPEDRRRNSAKRRRSDEVSDLDSDLDDALSEASWNSEDDPDRLWCICRKPHNNRFMICCDVCEEWFHGKCVGITKTIGKQMEQDGLEWSCPNCTKKKKVEEHDKEAEKIKILKEKMAQSIKDQQLKIKESQKIKTLTVTTIGKDKVIIKSPKIGSSALKQTKISDFSHASAQESDSEETVGRKCIMCKGPVRENSIYCSDDCIRKHSQHAISQLMSDSNKKSNSDSSGSGPSENARLIQKLKNDKSRIVVMDSNSKKFLVGPSAPTAANLTKWLKENPSYHVVYQKNDKPGKILLTSRKVVKIATKSGVGSPKVFVQKVGDPVKSTQLKLAISPNSKQINILQPEKEVYQIINSNNPSGKTAYVVKPKQMEIIEALPFPVKTVVTKGNPVKGVKEVTSSKVVGNPTTTNKEPTAAAKQEKVQRKRKEKVQKPVGPPAGKDSKPGQPSKQDDPKEKEKDKKDTDQQIRDSVKKTLAETLKTRVQENKNMEYNEEMIDSLAVKIEEKLFKHFENKVDTKYKSKYRSLIFNIKDPKNETLYKKIVDSSISPKELVKLSPEEMASQELARWREKENQHQLEMIKKTELELMAKGNTYIMKSHKGEQVIETEQSEKVAAVAAEIDPNTPAQELVSALNSVTSTTQETKEDEEKKKGKSETTLLKMRKREKEKRRSRDRKHDRRDKDRRRSSSRSSKSRSHRSKNKKRSRSEEKEKEKEKDKYKYRDKKGEKKKEREIKEEPESAEEKTEEKLKKNEIPISDEMITKTEKKSVEDDEADREPSSTVIIKTPDISMEEPEPEHLWKGFIAMADVAKFNGIATEISGDCGGISIDLGEKVDVVGRIPFDTVWDYIARMKKMGTKDILVIKITPASEDEKASYVTLYSYLSKRSRIGVIGKTSDAVKDFYLYPLPSHSPLPQVLLPLDGPSFNGDRENTILGIIVRNKHRSRHLGIVSDSHKISKKISIVETDVSSVPDGVPDRSYTPPLPEKGHDEFLKKDRQKRKIRVRMGFKELPDASEEVEDMGNDDDSPYSPGDSDEDLPPLPKMAKSGIPPVSNSISKLLTPRLTAGTESTFQDPAEIQRKIEEMNRAIEEQTQQIQSLTSAVPKLATGTVLPNLPLLANVTSAIMTPSALSPTSFPLPGVVNPLATAPPIPLPIPSTAVKSEVLLPLLSESENECSNPPKSFTPPLKMEENIPFLPEVTSKISLPSNLQEILNSIQKKTGAEDSDGGVKEGKPGDIKGNPADIKTALNVLNQTKNFLSTLSKPKEEKSESQPILSRLTDQELLEKVKEMEMEESSAALMGSINPCPPQPLPPGVQDIPLLTQYTNPPPPSYFSKPLIIPPTAGYIDPLDDKKPDKKNKLDPKSVFENDGVPDFVNIPGTSWEEKKSQKSKNYKIDIKLAMNTLERKTIDMDHFDIESISKMSEIPSGSGLSQGPSDETKYPGDDTRYSMEDTRYSADETRYPVVESRYSVDDRVLPPKGPEDRYRSPHDRDRRRSDDREIKRDWKYRRHWEDDKRYKEDFRRHGRRGERPKFRPKDRFNHKQQNRHLQKEWDGSIKNFEERMRWRNPDLRRDEIRRSRKRADSSSN